MARVEWKHEARCAGQDTEHFYPPRDRTMYAEFAEKAKVFCLGYRIEDGSTHCPVINDCLMFALRTEERHGIWGGLSTRERSALMRSEGDRLPWWITEEELIAVRKYIGSKSSEIIETEEVSGYDEEGDGRPWRG